MASQKKEKLTIEELARNLAGFAIDRTDLKGLIQALPADNKLNLTTVEYELGILKILSVGWGLSFYMAVSDPNKPLVTESFWEMIREISSNISTLTETTTGTSIDYFDILKQRLDTYVEAMKSTSDPSADPAALMGPEFARLSNSPDDAMAILTGTKMFTLTLGAVKEYLNAVDIEKPTLH